MGDDCALCVDAAVFDEDSPEWEEYLRDEREKTFIGSPRVPLCAGCRPEYDILKSGDMAQSRPMTRLSSNSSMICVSIVSWKTTGSDQHPAVPRTT